MSFAPILHNVPGDRAELLDFIEAARTAEAALARQQLRGGRSARYVPRDRAELGYLVRQTWIALTPDSTGSTDSVTLMCSDLEDVAVTWLRENGR